MPANYRLTGQLPGIKQKTSQWKRIFAAQKPPAPSIQRSLPGMYESSRIIGLNIHHLSFKESLDTISEWGLQHKPGFVCFANVHMTIEAYNDPQFRKDLELASLILPDGKPLAIASHWLHRKKQERIAGMDFMPAILERASTLNAKVFLYGSEDTTLAKLEEQITIRYPGVILAGMISPPFRPLTAAEKEADIQQINHSGAHFVLVALGCPKQEKWMAGNYTSINAPLLGLGGAFPVMANVRKRSPKWMQQLALEWLYRLLQEPGRMFKRYFYTNSLFIWLLLKELVKPKPKESKA
jgi:N-acetylglucosaminyldiphosphoundecaprenol N-acetyl-beta-D-mannosaminyltransferase